MQRPPGISDDLWHALTRDLPEATAAPCSECPWRRNADPGHLGPYNAGEWCEIAHGEAAIACHTTITETDKDGHGDWEHPAMRQCRGAAIFRANVLKTPKNPNIATGPADHEQVFSTNGEFIAHHHGVDDYIDPRGQARRARARKDD